MERIDVNGIYKHSPMNEAQINAEKNDDREIVINETQVTEAAPASSSDTDRTKFNPSYRCDTIYGKIRRNIATLETLALDGSQSTNDNLCGADLIGIDSTETYGVIQDATTVQGAIKELDTAVSEGGDLSNPVEELLVMEKGFKLSTPGTWRDPYDGHVYKTVTIGNQTWLAENYQGGYSWVPGGNAANVADYGGLYGGSGIFNRSFSDGWRVPTVAEWNTLVDTVKTLYGFSDNTQAILAMLDDEVGWSSYTDHTNITGMSLRAAGMHQNYPGNYFTGFNGSAYYWTTDLYSFDNSSRYYKSFGSSGAYGQGNAYWKNVQNYMLDGCAIRLVRDASVTDPEITSVLTTMKGGTSDWSIPTTKAVKNETLSNVITAKGDLVFGNSSGNQVQRLGIGTAGQTLMVSSSGTPYWASLYLGTFTTANRPTDAISGAFGFDLTKKCVVWFMEGVWVDAAGAQV